MPSRFRVPARLIVGLQAACMAALALMALLVYEHEMSNRLASAGAIACVLVMASVATVAMLASARQREGRHRRVWQLFALGCLGWALGGAVVLPFLETGGSPNHLPWWVQAAFALEYPPWIAALWLLSGRVVAESRRRLWEVLGLEVVSFVVAVIVVVGAVYYGPSGSSQQAANLVPIALDLMLVAAAYNAVRRASFHWRSAYPWMALAFVTLALADTGNVMVMVRHDSTIAAFAGPMALFCATFALLGLAADRPLELSGMVLNGDRLTATLATAMLSLTGPASFLAPRGIIPLVWLMALAMGWRVHAILRRQDRGEKDPITGLPDARAIDRHLGSVLATATVREPVGVIAVDLTGFSGWNAANGFTAGDAVLAEVGEACSHSLIGPGVWGRIGPDRFCWIGRVTDMEQGRLWAETALMAAEVNTAGIPARAALVMCPSDAATAANAHAALDEALTAAAQGAHRTVAFDRGLLDGAHLEGTYSASFRTRRERVAEVIGDPGAVYPVFQPIVRLSSLAVVGHEGLSRVERQPYRSPDQWINEAHQVGLGLELESECIKRVAARTHTRPGGTYLSVNASPQLLLSGLLDPSLPEGDLSWLVIEITEHERVRDYGALASRLAEARTRGARVAVDDVGAGHSTLRHVMRLSPDYAKLDRSMVEGVDRDPAKQALIRSMVAFSREMACTLVAEGIETLPELEMLRDLGVRFGQGYLFRRPATDMTATLMSIAPGVRPRVSEDEEALLQSLPSPLRVHNISPA
ncbi:MAG: bifunctional diguanylate cyclase/phosphodiesterase [Thermoleophilia bacterium]